ncbi:MAG: pyridoxal-phosphate dependent enzyme [Saprospiraceae bacterium]
MKKNYNPDLLKELDIVLPSPCEKLNLPFGLPEIYCKRDDLIHPVISGNKWRKLEGHLAHYFQNNYVGIVTVGSIHSNFLHAIAYVAFKLKIPLRIYYYGVGDIGKSPVIKDLVNWNSEIFPIQRNYLGSNFLQDISTERNSYFIPEGGGGILGEIGISKLVSELGGQLDKSENAVLVATGTGTTIRGIMNNTTNLHALTYTPVKSMEGIIVDNRIKYIFLKSPIKFGGYSEELMEFILNFYKEHKILLDPIYTSVLMKCFIENPDCTIPFSKVYFIHTGGLQAWRSYLIRYPKALEKLKLIELIEIQKIIIELAH